MSNDADYIVVGAGSAGCVLAAEISRRRLGTVILIECGTNPTSRHLKVPVQYPHAFKGTHSWQNESKPQIGLAGRKIQLSAGKTLGGSGAINAMIYLRGHASDYRRWEQVLGPDWSPDKVASAFDAMEKRMGICYATYPELHAATQEFLASANGSSLPLLDPFLEPAIGVGAFARCQENGRRRSAWDLWMKRQVQSVHNASSFRLILNASVQRLIINQQKVVGVSLVASEINAPPETLTATKGVIVCAGAIQSPRLLLASGIGDADDLKQVGIQCKFDLPAVGKQLQDHLLYPVVRSLKRHRSLPSRMNDNERYAYAKDRSGPMTSNIAEVGGFLSFPNQLDDSSDFSCLAPDFQWHVTPTHYLEYPNRPEPTEAFSIAVSLCRPTSRGTIRLVPATHSESNSRHELEIDPGYLTSADDLGKLLAAVKQTRSLFEGESFSELVGEELMPVQNGRGMTKSLRQSLGLRLRFITMRELVG